MKLLSDYNSRVSIIIPLHNAEHFIEQTLNSVLSQNYHNWELILIDDASKDKTLQKIKLYLHDKRITLLKTSNRNRNNATFARNLGISKAKGRWIALLDHDDLWHPNKLSLQISHHIKSGASISCTFYRMFRGTHFFKIIKIKPINTIKDIFGGNPIPASSVIIDRDKIKDFKMKTSLISDYSTWHFYLKQGRKIEVVPIDLMMYRLSNSNASKNKFSMATKVWVLHRLDFQLNLMFTFFYFIKYFITSIKKYESTYIHN
jgi:glycosyltransferase involved in cell wall biosynthesis